jgi:hypothetical protein
MTSLLLDFRTHGVWKWQRKADDFMHMYMDSRDNHHIALEKNNELERPCMHIAAYVYACEHFPIHRVGYATFANDDSRHYFQKKYVL